MNNNILEKTFSNVNHWLSFAEAKNTVLAGFLVAALKLIDLLNGEMPTWSISIILALIFISLLFPLLSFFPLYSKSQIKHQGDNLIFFRDIAGFSCEEYYKKLEERYPVCFDNISEKEKNLYFDYINEIIINSRITVSKMRLFIIGISISGINIVFCCIMLLVC